MKKLKYNTKYTYAQLCEVLNLTPCSGSKQQTQLKQIEDNYKLLRPKRNQYIIQNELNAIQKAEMQTYHKTKNYIEPLLFNILSEKKDNIIIADMHQIMVMLKMVNKNYHYAKWHTKKCDNYITGQDKSGLSIFSKETEPMLKNIIKKIFNDMEDRKLIFMNKIPMFAIKYKDAQTGKIITKCWEADKDIEIPKLLEAERQSLKRLGYQKESDIGYYDITEYKDIIAEILGISYFYYKYEIILNHIGLKEYINSDYKELGKSFNKYIQNKIKQSKQGKLKLLTDEEKMLYTWYCIDIEQTVNLKTDLIDV